MRANKIQVNQRIYVKGFIGARRQNGRKPFSEPAMYVQPCFKADPSGVLKEGRVLPGSVILIRKNALE